MHIYYNEDLALQLSLPHSQYFVPIVQQRHRVNVTQRPASNVRNGYLWSFHF